MYRWHREEKSKKTYMSCDMLGGGAAELIIMVQAEHFGTVIHPILLAPIVRKTTMRRNTRRAATEGQTGKQSIEMRSKRSRHGGCAAHEWDAAAKQNDRGAGSHPPDTATQALGLEMSRRRNWQGPSVYTLA